MCIEAGQLALFDLGLPLAPLREEMGRLLSHSDKALNTRKYYGYTWTEFEKWCADAGRAAFPATPETVRLYATWILRRRQRIATARTKLYAIASRHREAGHDSPVDAAVKLLVNNAARERRERPRGKRALSPELLARMSQRMLQARYKTDTRNRAILVFGFALGWRGSEICSLELSDLAFETRTDTKTGEEVRGLSVRLGPSKGDQLGTYGRVVWIPAGRKPVTCPVLAVEGWLAQRGFKPGPLFGIGAVMLIKVIKRQLRLVGVDPTEYGSHSLRAGMATAAAEAGASETAIMLRGGWRSIQTVARYVRPASAFRNDPLAGVL